MHSSFRQHFPSLQRQHKGRTAVYLDGPGGTQVPHQVIDAVRHYYENSNANLHGAFPTAQESDEVMERARQSGAAFLGAEGPHCISFGANMTSLNYHLARAFARHFQPGDEILITQLDHEANRGPWLSLREHGIIVKEISLLPEGRLDYEDFERKLNHRTRLVAMGVASNLLGTVNDVARVRRATHATGSWLLLDAVHYAPHFPIDVQAMGCDFLLCSAYKFYGPHVGLLYSRPGLLDRLPIQRLRTASQQAPDSIETGTQNHAAIAGVEAAIRFIAELGEGPDLRSRLYGAMERIREHEFSLVKRLYKALADIHDVEIYGPSTRDQWRTPTLAVTVEGHHPHQFAKQLADRSIFAWDGHFYALRGIEVLGLRETGGVVRLGISAYTTEEEVEYTIEQIRELNSASGTK